MNNWDSQDSSDHTWDYADGQMPPMAIYDVYPALFTEPNKTYERKKSDKVANMEKTCNVQEYVYSLLIPSRENNFLRVYLVEPS